MSNDQEAAPIIAFLGAGQMGEPMARRLIGAGFTVRVWNRTAARVASLIESGATGAATPAIAAEGADLIVTMLTDAPAVEAVVSGDDGALATASRGAVWLQMSTIGVDGTDRLRALAAASDVLFVDAPVSGSVELAASGRLLILASGPLEAQPAAARAFDAMGRHTYWLGEAGGGSRAKLVLNNWLVDLVEMTVETLKLTQALGLDANLLVDILADAPIGSPYAVAKARSMLLGDFTTNFALKHAVKDALLALDAAHGVDRELPLTASLISSWQGALASGGGDLDLSVVYRFAEH
jgi:3-hydroxyisobutyrate dehydrogenase